MSIRMWCYTTDLRDRNIEVEVLAHDGTREENDEHGKSGVLKISQLNFHSPELDTPADGRVRRRWLESKGLPVGGLEVLMIIVGQHPSRS